MELQREDGCWDLNLGMAAIGGRLCGSEVKRRGPRGSDGMNREDPVVLECFFLPRGLGCRRHFAWKKRGERTLAGGP